MAKGPYSVDSAQFYAELQKQNDIGSCASLFKKTVAHFGFDTFACGEVGPGPPHSGNVNEMNGQSVEEARFPGPTTNKSRPEPVLCYCLLMPHRRAVTLLSQHPVDMQVVSN